MSPDDKIYQLAKILFNKNDIDLQWKKSDEGYWVSDSWWRNVDKQELETLMDIFKENGYEVVDWRAGESGTSLLIKEIDES